MRLLILIFLAFVLYRLVRRYIGSVKTTEPAGEGGPVDEMVQDPSCMTYIPKRTAYRRIVAGREYFFCGQECADRFEKKSSEEGEK